MIMNKPDKGYLSYYNYVDRFISYYWYDWIILLIPGWAGWFERRLISCLLYTVHCTLYTVRQLYSGCSNLQSVVGCSPAM